MLHYLTRSNRARALFFTIAAGLLAGCVTACGGSSGGGNTPGPQPLNWTACDKVPNTQCTTIQVPVDHANPSGGSLTLRLARVQKVANQNKNLGMMLIIPGGPGVGINDTFGINRANAHIDDFYSQHFDVVSFDPRGVGQSTPIQCAGPIPTPIAPLNDAPTSDQFNAIGAANAAFVQTCTSTNDLMQHLTSNDTADDIESIRQTLTPNRKLVAYSASYGTLYSAMYLERHGDNVKTLVMDGVFDHSIQFPMNLTTDIAATQDAFNQFSTWCEQTPSCALYGKEVGTEFAAAIAAAPGLQYTVPARFPAGPPCWPSIAQAISSKTPPPTPSDLSPLQGPTGLFLGVTCGDEGPQTDYASLVSTYTPVLAASPFFAFKFWDATPYLHLGAGVGDCVGWPFPAGNPPHVLNVGPHPNVLIANDLHDPATSINYALSVWAQIPQARLLTADANGHQSMFFSQCAYEKIRSFVIDNKSLPLKTECPAEPPTDKPCPE